ncbi:MAG: agarase, partial [Spirochaetia bacterium]|nr:agarase [Spirochaetia bacterium]
MVSVQSPGSSPAAGAGEWKDFKTRSLEGLKGYATHTNEPNLSAFGGWKSLRVPASGFFRVTNIMGRWWGIDPKGYGFLATGIDFVGAPKRDAAAKKFGSLDRWAAHTADTIRSWGFANIGVETDLIPVFRKVEKPLPYTWRVLAFMASFGKMKGYTKPAAGHTGYSNDWLPVFHPEFETYCSEFAKQLESRKDDPWLLGIYSDNELPAPIDMLEKFLRIPPDDPEFKSGYAAAAAWLKGRKGTLELRTITPRDRYEFIAFVFERYYRVVSEAIRKVDPNHLYLGTRICYETQYRNEFFWKTISRYVDVISINYYGVWGPEAGHVARWRQWADKPVIISEWYAKGNDVKLSNTRGAGTLVRGQEERGLFYQHFVLGALESGIFVGWQWLKFVDDPVDSTALDAAGGANKGFVDP